MKSKNVKISVLVTAVPGSGKTTAVNSLLNLGYLALDIESIPGLFRWVDDKTGEPVKSYIDDIKTAKKASWKCNIAKLQNLIDEQKEELVFFCGAGGNIDEMWSLFDQVIILQVSDETTVDRLSTRGPNEFGHTKEVRDWILTWKHNEERQWLINGAISVNGEADQAIVARKIVAASSQS